MKTYTLPASVEAIESMALDTPERAVVVKNARGRAIGVFVAPDEYNVLRSTYELVKEPDGIAKISGSYEPKPAGTTFEQINAGKPMKENYTIVACGFSVTFGARGRVDVYIETEDGGERRRDDIEPAAMRQLGEWLVEHAASTP